MNPLVRYFRGTSPGGEALWMGARHGAIARLNAQELRQIVEQQVKRLAWRLEDKKLALQSMAKPSTGSLRWVTTPCTAPGR
ncbi:hypothetical protein WH5701_09194 [Synechococcus sp. WH 5701]|nr:hypothetical protein WH5701_09194 [Synechococcus sp. WH 5701]